MKKEHALTTLRRVLGQRVRRLSPEDARKIIVAHANGSYRSQIGDPAYRALTGGFSSQSIDGLVTRALARRAGIVR